MLSINNQKKDRFTRDGHNKKKFTKPLIYNHQYNPFINLSTDEGEHYL